MLYWENIDPGNWRVRLEVGEDQQEHVSDRMSLLARAYAYRNERSRACILMDDEMPVGMALYHDWDEGGAYVLSQFFIDKRYQGMGYGVKGAGLLLDDMRQDGKYQQVSLCYIDGENNVRPFWEKVGFIRWPEDDDDEDELGMRLKL